MDLISFTIALDPLAIALGVCDTSSERLYVCKKARAPLPQTCHQNVVICTRTCASRSAFHALNTLCYSISASVILRKYQPHSVS